MKPLTRQEGLDILMRDQFRCQYCGLDGTASFENALIMTVDFVTPRAEGGEKTPANLVAACRTCNLMKGRQRFMTLEEAKAHILKRREERRREWEQHMVDLRSRSA